MDTKVDYSSEPVLVNNLLAHENLADNQISVSQESNRKWRSTQATSSDQAEDSKAKRKLVLGVIGEDYTSSEVVPSPPSLISNEVPIPALPVEPQEDDHDAPADFCLVGIEELLKPLPFINPAIPLGRVKISQSHHIMCPKFLRLL
jgi:hypothetical protein